MRNVESLGFNVEGLVAIEGAVGFSSRWRLSEGLVVVEGLVGFSSSWRFSDGLIVVQGLEGSKVQCLGFKV